MTQKQTLCEDEALVEALRKGDQGAFAALYKKYAGPVFRYMRCNLYDRQDCEDSLQEIFESLWRRRKELQIQTSLQAYLLGMARYKVVEYFRKGALKKRHFEYFMVFEALFEEAAIDLDPDTLQVRLNRIIDKLPDRCKEAVRLRLTENLSNSDIAKRMKITTRTVETYMFRAFNFIRAKHTKRSITEG